MKRVLALTFVVALAACGDGGTDGVLDEQESPSVATVDTDGLEEQLAHHIAKQAGRKIVSVDCPQDVQAERGGTFECTAEEKSGGVFTIEVTQRDDQGNVDWFVKDAEAP